MPGSPEEMAKLDKLLDKDLDKINKEAKNLGLDKKLDTAGLASDAAKLAKEIEDEPD